MSGRLARLPFFGTLNRTGSAGPRRLLAIAGGAAVVVGAIVAVASIQSRTPPVSRPGALPRVDPLPGGLHSNPQQDSLHVIANQEQAARAQQQGNSFTPVMPASRPYVAPPVAAPPVPRPAAASAEAVPAPALAVGPTPPAPVVQTVPAPIPAIRPMAAASPSGPMLASPAVAQTPARTPQEDAAFKAALDRMMAGWGGKPPRTEVICRPRRPVAAEGSGAGAPGQGRRRLSGDGVVADAWTPAAATPIASSAARQRVLVPAGRGIYAHTILAANSDAQSPVVLQADSGPLAGDRMIGTFSRQRDRLIIRITKVIHQNEEIGVDGVVVAPGSMEVGVASSVDQNYLSRFALPAAAAFVQGLGQAIAQSNSTSVLGPLGSVTAQNRLNFDQQLGIAAGVAGAQIGAELQQSAPHGPTVILDVGSSVGVLFLTNVSSTRS